MMYLHKKLIKDLWTLKHQFVAVFIMALMGVIIYTGMEGVWMGMQDYADKWFADSNGADAWVSGVNLDNADLDKIKALPNIADAQASTLLSTQLKNARAYLLLIASPNNTISRPFVSAGKEYNAEADGIWLYQEFAKSHNLTVGKSVTVQNGGKTYVFVIQGLLLSPDYLSYTGSSASIKPDRDKYGYGYISPNNMEKIMRENARIEAAEEDPTKATGDTARSSEDTKRATETSAKGAEDVAKATEDTAESPSKGLLYNQVKLKLQKSDDIRNVRADIEKILGPKYAGLVTVAEFKGTSAYIDKYSQIRIMSILFSVIFIFLAMLTIQTTMKRLVETQRIQIGTFKALGYSNKSLLLHYSLYGFFISIAGVLAGYCLAPYFVTDTLLTIQKDLFALPEWNGKYTVISLLVGIIIILGCTLSAIWACQKMIKEMPSMTMRGEPPKDHKPIFLEHFRIWQQLAYDWQWILRDSQRNKIRFIIGTISIIGSITLLMASFGLMDSLTTANKRLFGHQFNYGAKIIIHPTATEEDKNNLFELTNRDAQWVQEGDIEIRTAGHATSGTLLVLEEGYFVHLENIHGDRVTLPQNGLAISRKLAEELDITVNDIVQFKYGGSDNYIAAVVKEIVTPPAPQGLYISKPYWETLSQPFIPSALLAQNDKVADQAQIYTYVKEVVKLEQQLDEANDVLNSVMMIIVMLLVGAILLSVIIQYNLGMLSFTERSREYATLKVVGYRKDEIKSMIRKRNQLQVVLGLLLGIPLGYQFLRIYVPIISTHTLEISPYLKPQSLLISLLIVIVCSYLVTLIVARKSDKLDMVSALKSVE